MSKTCSAYTQSCVCLWLQADGYCGSIIGLQSLRWSGKGEKGMIILSSQHKTYKLQKAKILKFKANKRHCFFTQCTTELYLKIWRHLTAAGVLFTHLLKPSLSALSSSSTPQNISALVGLGYWIASLICFIRILPEGVWSMKDSRRKPHTRQKLGTSLIYSLCLELLFCNDCPMRYKSAGRYPPLPVEIQSYSHFLSKLL